MGGLGTLLDLLLLVPDALTWGAAEWAALGFVFLLSLAALAAVRSDRAWRRTLAKPVFLLALAPPGAAGAVLLHGGLVMSASQLSLERASDSVTGRLVRCDAVGDPLVRPRGQLFQFHGEDRTYIAPNGELDGKVEVGDNVTLWYSDGDEESEIRILQADVNGVRRLTWTPERGIPAFLALLGLGLLGLVVAGAFSFKADSILNENLELTDASEERLQDLRALAGTWVHPSGARLVTLTVGGDGSLSADFETRGTRLEFADKLRPKANQCAALDGACTFYSKGSRRGTLRVCVRLRREGSSLSGTLEIRGAEKSPASTLALDLLRA